MIKPPDQGSNLTGLLFSASGGVMASGQPIVKVRGSYQSNNTPGFRSYNRYQRKYEMPWHPFTYVREVWKQSPAAQWGGTSMFAGPQYQTGYKLSYGPYQAAGWVFFGQWPWTTTDAPQKALSKLQGKIARMSVNLAQALGERKQTVSLVTDSVKKLAYAAKAIKHGNFGYAIHLFANYGRPAKGVSHFKQTTNNLANYWLEFQYGWRPLLSDIQGSLEALATAHGNFKPISFSASSEVESEMIRFFGRLEVCPGWTATLTCTERITDLARYVLEVEEEQSVMQSLASTGVTNPALLAWELLPYSFVVDWLLPVGSYLEQLEYARGLTFKRGTFSLRRKGSVDWLPPAVKDEGGDSWIYSGLSTGGFVRITLDEKTRTVLGGFPYQEFPSFKPKLGVERALNAISLLTQVFNRGRTTAR